MGATYFKNALSTRREYLTIDWDALEQAWKTMSERQCSEDTQRDIKWANSYNDGRFSGPRRDPSRTKTVLRPRQEDLDIAGLQHNRVSNE